jgi:membrane protein implicated in regulation of membrane protease activity
MQDIFVAKIAKVIPVPIDLILVGIYLHFYFFDLIACIYIYIKKVFLSRRRGEREKRNLDIIQLTERGVRGY